MTDGHGDCGGPHIGGMDAASGGTWVPQQAPSAVPIEKRPEVNGAPVDDVPAKVRRTSRMSGLVAFSSRVGLEQSDSYAVLRISRPIASKKWANRTHFHDSINLRAQQSIQGAEATGFSRVVHNCVSSERLLT